MKKSLAFILILTLLPGPYGFCGDKDSKVENLVELRSLDYADLPTTEAQALQQSYKPIKTNMMQEEFEDPFYDKAVQQLEQLKNKLKLDFSKYEMYSLFSTALFECNFKTYLPAIFLRFYLIAKLSSSGFSVAASKEQNQLMLDLSEVAQKIQIKLSGERKSEKRVLLMSLIFEHSIQFVYENLKLTTKGQRDRLQAQMSALESSLSNPEEFAQFIEQHNSIRNMHFAISSIMALVLTIANLHLLVDYGHEALEPLQHLPFAFLQIIAGSLVLFGPPMVASFYATKTIANITSGFKQYIKDNSLIRTALSRCDSLLKKGPRK